MMVTALCRTGVRILSPGLLDMAWVVLIYCLPGQFTEVLSGLKKIMTYSVARLAQELILWIVTDYFSII